MKVHVLHVAESKIRQIGGEVCGVLVRTEGGLAAVTDMGRVIWVKECRSADSDTDALQDLRSRMTEILDEISSNESEGE